MRKLLLALLKIEARNNEIMEMMLEGDDGILEDFFPTLEAVSMEYMESIFPMLFEHALFRYEEGIDYEAAIEEEVREADLSVADFLSENKDEDDVWEMKNLLE